MKLRRVFPSRSSTPGSTIPSTASSSSSSSSSPSSVSPRVQWINRILLMIGVATLTADVLFFWFTTEAQQQLRLHREKRRYGRLNQPKQVILPDQQQQQQQQEEEREQPVPFQAVPRKRQEKEDRSVRGNNHQYNNKKQGNQRQQAQKHQEQQRHPLLSIPVNNQLMHENYRLTHAQVLAVFDEAGIALTEEDMQDMPTWDQVVELYGADPVLVGVPDHCQVFQQRVPAVERMIGSAGMFNTGTNLVTQLLKENCKIPERVQKYGMNATREAHGIRWQVPWGKHTPAHFRKLHATKQASAAGIDKDAILPVITVRDPYEWMKSMCRNPYTVKWPHNPNLCPHLAFEDGSYNGVHVKYANDRYQEAQSLAHLWNDWYRDYYNITPSVPEDEEEKSQQQRQVKESEEEDPTDEDESASPQKDQHNNLHNNNQNEHYPWIMVRMEDLIFHAKETITKVCSCIGGVVRTDRPFTYIVDSAKCDSPGHDCSTGLAQAWIKYGGRRRRNQRPLEEPGWTRNDYRIAQQVLDAELMEQLHYHHPQVPPF